MAVRGALADKAAAAVSVAATRQAVKGVPALAPLALAAMAEIRAEAAGSVPPTAAAAVVRDRLPAAQEARSSSEANQDCSTRMEPMAGRAKAMMAGTAWMGRTEPREPPVV